MLDISLGIKHDNPKSKEFLLAMRDYMVGMNDLYIMNGVLYLNTIYVYSITR